MSSKIPPIRIHVAILNSLRAIEIMGGGDNKVTQISGQYSRNIESTDLASPCPFIQNHLRNASEIYVIRWTAQGDDEGRTVNEILKELENEECPDVFLKSLTIVKPWIEYSPHLLKNIDAPKHFMFHAHPFKPSVFARLKGRMPSFQLYSQMKEIRARLSADLDDETKKRWRDILLINIPHKKLTNQDIRQMWLNDTCHIFLKESRGKFDFMEIAETKGA